jgi:DNA-binding NarL/FixJ family response regulator
VPSVLICAAAPEVRERLARRAAGITGVRSVATAGSGTEALARFGVTPADLVLIDAGLRDPDGVQTTRLLLARRPGTEIVLVATDNAADSDPTLATRAMAAGARGYLRADPSREDMALALAHALAARDGSRRAAPGSAVNGGPGRPMAGRAPGARTVPPYTGVPRQAGPPGQRIPAGVVGHPGTRPGVAVLPQRPGDPRVPVRLPVGAGMPVGAPTGHRMPPGMVPAQGSAHLVGGMTGNPVSAPPAPPAGRRVAALSERELQVLNGMSDGKSNAEIGRDLFLSEDTVKTHARRLFRKLGVRDRAHAVAAGFRMGIVT